MDSTCLHCKVRPLAPRKNAATCGEPECVRKAKMYGRDPEAHRAKMRERMARKRATGAEVERMEDRPCEACGRMFRIEARRGQRFCSQACNAASQDMAAKSRRAAEVRGEIVDRHCKVCGVAFEGTRWTRFCSAACRWFGRYAGASCALVWSTCRGCGNEFARQAASQYCSKKCRAGRPRKWRRHAAEVYGRDAMTCQLCGRATGIEWVAGDPLSPTLDHIVPRSHGGSDDPANLRTAHFACNVMRGDRANVHRVELADALAYVGFSLAA